MDGDVTAPRDEVLLRLAPAIFRTDDDALFLLEIHAKLNDPVNLSDHRLIFWNPRLKEFGHTGQSPGDVLVFGKFSGNLGEDVSGMDLLPVLNHQFSLDREVELCICLVLSDDCVLLLVADDQLWAVFLIRRFLNHLAGHPGHFVHLLLEGLALDNRTVLDKARHIRENRHREGIPLGNPVALLHL